MNNVLVLHPYAPINELPPFQVWIRSTPKTLTGSLRLTYSPLLTGRERLELSTPLYV